MEDIFAKHIKRLEEITYIHVKGAKDRSEEFHHFHEIIYLSEGTATFISDNMHLTIKEGTLLVIPAGTYHQLSFDDALRKHQRCVFHFLDLPEYKELISACMKDVVTMHTNKEMRSVFYRMNALCEQSYSQDTKCALLSSALFILLHEISSNLRPETTNHSFDSLVPKAINYISDHLTDSFSVSDIASELKVSVSALAHTFKTEMNISIYQYILKKRLIMARNRIIDGESPSQAALGCGFNDYSSFYRRYKKLFHVSPSSKDQGIFDFSDIT